MPDQTTKLTRFRFGGLNWVAEPWAEEMLRSRVLPGLEHPEDAGAETVKRSTTRAIYRLEVEGRAVVIKQHRLRSARERLKYLVVRSRAAAEWTASRTMALRGLPVPRPVAFGERRVAGFLCEAVLITEEISDARALSDLLEKEFAPDSAGTAAGTAFRSKRALLRAVADLIRRTHESDVLHCDLHGGNILVKDETLFLIDLHRTRLGPVSDRRRAANLGQLFAFLPDLLSPDDRMHVLRSYRDDDSEQALRAFARSVGRFETRIRERRYVSRSKRCVKRSTGFRHGRVRGLRMHRRADFPSDLVGEAIEKHRTAQTALKEDHRARVTAVEVGGREVCVKEFVRPALFKRIADLVRGSKAMRAWRGAHALAVRGIETPTPLAMAEAGGRSYLLTAFISEATELKHFAARHCRPGPGEPARRWHRFVRQAAEFVRRLHDHRVYHRDLSAKNILVREDGDGWQLLLVDAGDVSQRRRPPSLSEKVRNLGQLDQIYVKPALTDRLRFYRRYSRGRPEFDDPALLARIDAISRERHEHWLESEEAKRVGADPDLQL